MSDSSTTIAPVTIDVVSDVVCPWCFIGKRRLEKALSLKPNIPVEVRFHPYFLNPWVPREGMTRDEYLTTKFGSPDKYTAIAGRVAAAAAAEGLTYAVDKMRRQPNTLDCHRLILWAQSIGKAACSSLANSRSLRLVGPSHDTSPLLTTRSGRAASMCALMR